MATSVESVLKPDHAARRKHFIFTDEHEQLRESIRAFAVKELAPHAEEWEETTFPDSVFRRMGELGFLGLDKPEEYGGQGGDYFSSLVLAEEIVHAQSGGLAMGVAVHTDMAMPPILAFGTEEQKQEWVVPAIRGEKILCLGITEPDAGSDVAGIKTRAVRDGDEYVINGSKTYITNGHRADVIVLVTKTDPDAGYDGFTLFLVPMDAPGVIREKKLREARHARHRHGAAGLPGRPRARHRGPRPGRQGLLPHHVGAPGRAPDRRRGLRRRRPALLRADAAVRARSAPRSAARSASSRSSATSSPRWRRRSRRPARWSTSTAWRFANGEYPVREISMAKLHASRVACEVADECIQIHGGAGYMKEYGVERVWRDMRLNRIGAGTDEIMLDVIGRSYGL